MHADKPLDKTLKNNYSWNKNNVDAKHAYIKGKSFYSRGLLFCFDADCITLTSIQVQTRAFVAGHPTLTSHFLSSFILFCKHWNKDDLKSIFVLILDTYIFNTTLFTVLHII